MKSSASDCDSDSDIDSDPEKSDKSTKSDKSSALDRTRDLPYLPIPQSLNWMRIFIRLQNAVWRAFPAVGATEFTSPKWMVPVPVRRHTRQPGCSGYWMPEVRESDDWHAIGEYISGRAVFSKRKEADGHIAELEALGLAGVPVQEQPEQQPKQKKRAYGGRQGEEGAEGHCCEEAEEARHRGWPEGQHCTRHL